MAIGSCEGDVAFTPGPKEQGHVAWKLLRVGERDQSSRWFANVPRERIGISRGVTVQMLPLGYYVVEVAYFPSATGRVLRIAAMGCASGNLLRSEGRLLNCVIYLNSGNVIS
jgi:hypothetical protein